MQKKNIVIHYIITLVTSGFYAPYWALSMAKSLNALAGEERIETKKRMFTFLALFALYFVGIVVMFFHFQERIQNQQLPETSFFTYFYATFAIGIAIFVVLVRLMLAVSKEIGTYDTTTQHGKGTVIALTVIYFAAFPLLQSQVNKLIEHNQSR